jgi:uncharacterized RDD family membrane protein YckC
MQCPVCNKEIGLEGVFCNWCAAFVPAPRAGEKAGVARRWFAALIDPLLFFAAWLIGAMILAPLVGWVGPLLVYVLCVAVYFKLLAGGQTYGKRAAGLRVISRRDGANPGLWRMFVREIPGKFVSAVPLSLGFAWAIWDRDTQAWHDKIASTVVVRLAEGRNSGAGHRVGPTQATNRPSGGSSAEESRSTSDPPRLAAQATLTEESQLALADPDLRWAPPPIRRAEIPSLPSVPLRAVAPPPRVEPRQPGPATPRPASEQRSTASAVPPIQPVARQRGHGPGVSLALLASFICISAAAGVGGEVWLRGHPYVRIENDLLVPVALALPGGPDMAVAPGATWSGRSAPNVSLGATWRALGADTADLNRPDGMLRGIQPATSSRFAWLWPAFSIVIRARSQASQVFAPLVSNASSHPLRLSVNDGLQDENGNPVSRDCRCVIPPQSGPQFVGYFPLFLNSTVTLTALDDSTRAEIDGVAGAVNPASGSLALRITDRDLDHTR